MKMNLSVRLPICQSFPPTQLFKAHQISLSLFGLDEKKSKGLFILKRNWHKPHSKLIKYNNNNINKSSMKVISSLIYVTPKKQKYTHFH